VLSAGHEKTDENVLMWKELVPDSILKKVSLSPQFARS
jgi:hypothetical protein